MEAVQILVSILPRLLEKHPNVYLLLVGKDPPKISNPHVIATGFVENPAEFIAAADLAVVPLVSGGGTKLKMLDYMACGKAIVSTLAGAEGLDLENEKDALISQYPDSEFICLVMRAIEDAELRKKIGENARKKVKQLYNWEANAAKAINIYHALVRGHKSR
jgi:glycosyltransferase involved in cell wall biosynthesis